MKMPRSRGVILVIKPLKNEEKQAILNREVAQIHANAIIRRLSAKNVTEAKRRAMIDHLVHSTRGSD